MHANTNEACAGALPVAPSLTPFGPAAHHRGWWGSDCARAPVALYGELGASPAWRDILPVQHYGVWSLALAVVIAVAGTTVALRLRLLKRSPRMALVWVLSLGMVIDMVVAPIRYPYCDVLLLAALWPTLPLLVRHRPYRPLLLPVLAALATWITMPGSMVPLPWARHGSWIAHVVVLAAAVAIGVSATLRPPRPQARALSPPVAPRR
jgi:hypothetical protein